MFLVSIIHKEAAPKPCMDLAYKSSSAMATSLQKYNESISSKKTKNSTKSRRITRPGRRILDQRKTSERPSSPTASVVHVPVSRSLARCLTASLAGARSVARLSLGALSCSLVLSADLRFSAEHPRSYQPSWKSYLPPLVCLIYLLLL
jgi:hypothetical protein